MNSININRTIDNGSKEVKEIHELLEEDNNKYRLLGKAVGINMEHCVILGSKHSREFWNRVYGYRIIQNEKMEKVMVETIKKIKPEVESYITVCFYERRAEGRMMFVPKRLEIPDRPELNNFPFNILFGTKCLADNDMQTLETAEYVPDFSTFIKEGLKQKMKYYNTLDSERHYWVEIAYNMSGQSYVGIKYCGDKKIGMAFGKSWDMFFVHLTMLGVGSDFDIPITGSAL